MNGEKRDPKGRTSKGKYLRSSRESFQLNIRPIQPKLKELRNLIKTNKLDSSAEATSSSPTLIMLNYKIKTSSRPILMCQEENLKAL